MLLLNWSQTKAAQYMLKGEILQFLFGVYAWDYAYSPQNTLKGGNMCGPCPYTHIATPDDSLFYPFSDWFTYGNLSQIVNHGREYLLIEQINHYSFTCAARFCLIDMLTGIDR